MSRKNILLYIDSYKIYLSYDNKIITRSSDTFYRYGEIYDADKFIECLDNIFYKIKNTDVILKPNFTVLYNDTSISDIKFLIEKALASIGFNKIKFIKLTDLFKSFKNYDRLVIYDKDYYIIPSKKVKVKTYDIVDNILIGLIDDKHLHYSDKNMVFHTFKSRFTK